MDSPQFTNPQNTQEGEDTPPFLCQSFMEYLSNASKLMESDPRLVNSVLGLGPLEIENENNVPKPKPLKGFSSSDLIEDYERELQDEQGNWIYDLLQGISGWLYSTQANKDLSHQDLTGSKILPDEPLKENKSLDESVIDESFWNEWEWVLSRTEEIAIQQSEKRKKQIDRELKHLRREASHLQQRPYFVSKAQAILSVASLEESNLDFKGIFTQNQIDLIENVPLQASLRSKLLRDIIDQFSQEWLSFIGNTFFNDEPVDIPGDDNYAIFIENYAETTYSKNITGALVSMGFLASHGSGEVLTAQVLGDILWSWWSTLCRSIQEILDDKKCTQESLEKLAHQIIKSGPVIARVWCETVEHSHKTKDSTGILPEKWKQQEQAETQRLNNLRAVGLVDASFKDGPLQCGSRRSTMTAERLATVKQKLEEVFYTPPQK